MRELPMHDHVRSRKSDGEAPSARNITSSTQQDVAKIEGGFARGRVISLHAPVQCLLHDHAHAFPTFIVGAVPPPFEAGSLTFHEKALPAGVQPCSPKRTPTGHG